MAAFAQNATWLGVPSNSDFNFPANWTPATVPTGTATFGPSSVTSLTFSKDATVGTLIFNTPNYTFVGQPIVGSDLNFTINGVGIQVATPADAPTFNVDRPQLLFTGSSTAGPATLNAFNTGPIAFQDTSTAGNATINAGRAGSNVVTDPDGFTGGFVFFRNSSTAANATITTFWASDIAFQDTSKAGNATITAPVNGGSIFFLDASSADHATITMEDGTGELSFSPGFFGGGTATAGDATIINSGRTNFFQASTAGNATITTNGGGLTSFFGMSTGGNAAFITNAGGIVDFSGLGTFPDTGAPPDPSITGTTAGSIAGAGTYSLGSKQLTVGSNNLSTTVSGMIADGGAAGGTGGSLIKVGTGTLTLTGDDPNTFTYTGGTTVNGGTLVVGDFPHPLTALSGGGPISVGPGGTLGGYGSVTGSVVNSGVIAAGSATPGFSTSPTGAFTIIGNYSGKSGILAVNTFLGDDASPSDKLVINGGAATGNTTVRVTNIGGPGAETTGNGILVVNAINGATTAPGAFGLPAGELRAGAFDYDLLHGGTNGSSPNDWFLRSEFVVPPVIPPVVPPVMPPVVPPGTIPPVVPPVTVLPPTPPGPLPPLPPFPTDPPPAPLPPGVYPIIGPELATDGVVQPIARQMGLTMLGTLHERIGDTLTVENAGADAEGWGRSGWARFFGQQIDNRYQAFADPSTTGRLFGVQAGLDIWRGSFIPGHRDATGLYFAYGNAAMDVDGLITNATGTAYVAARTGTVNLYAYSGGAYWTHYGPGGWYLDAVVQGTAYTGNATTQFANLATDGSGIITSLEAGYPIPLPLGPRFVLEPQGQILWQHTSFGQANDGLGPVALGTTSGTTGRLGVRGQWSIITDNGQVWQPYVRTNLWQNWGGEATTTFGVDAVPLLEQSTQLEFAAGLTTKVNDFVSFYVQGGYEFAVGDTNGGRRQGVKGDFGVRLSFGHPPPPPPAPAAMPAPVAARSYLVFFDWDNATLTDRARQIIRDAANNSTHVQYTRIEVNGYTDTSGTPKYNQGLSVRRAEAVAAELVRDGIQRNVITIQGFGETHPLVPTGPGVREPQNRRVEIVMQ